VQGLPSGSGDPHVPLAPGLKQMLPPAQSAFDPQLVAHAVLLTQAKLPGQATGVPALHVPEPLQLPDGVNVLPEHHAAPHTVPDA
jgi:hypothetical protein